jgi:peptidoglycan/LPS O-acetylase OafA/YrhL
VLVAAAVLGSVFLGEGSWYIGHFWSLTVEEVFYLSWAPIMAFASRRFAICAAASILAIAGLVHLLNIAATSNHFAELFAFWPRVKVASELDGVAIGSLAALAGRGLTDALRARRAWVSRAVAALAWSIMCVSSLPLEQWVGVSALAWIITLVRRPILEAAVACVILLAAEAHRLGKTSWLENRPLIALGRASYSIYVVQQAFCVPGHERLSVFVQQPPLNVLLATATGFAAFVLFEDPVRRALVRRFKIAR